jgi:hypothetical protein
MHPHILRLSLGISLSFALTAVANPPAGSRGVPAKPADRVVHYEKPTPEQSAAAIADAQKFGKEVSSKLSVTFTEIQTDHFIMFTDWDPREHAFLKRNVEAAYTAVSRQFEMKPSDNIFIGKLPVFMFAKQAKFKEFGKTFTKMDVPNDVAGYYVGNDSGYGYMTMWKPDVAAAGGNVRAAERRWAHTLTHEFTHAFVARYRTNRHVPRWLNEGMAEVIAYGEFPDARAFAFAKHYAGTGRSVKNIFDDSQMPGGEMYPVMMTLVQALARENPRKFLKYFNAIKDGGHPEETLKEMYQVDYAGLEVAWRKYMKTATR